MLYLRRLFLVPLVGCVAYLTGCGDVSEPSARVVVTPQPSSSTLQTTTTTTIKIDWPAVERLAFVVWANKNAEAVEATQAASARRVGSTPAPVSAPSGDGCAEPIRSMLLAAFPDDQAWVIRTAMRESNCTAGAVNWREGCDTSGRTNSHAMGVMQMCYPLHAPTFAAVGCSDPLNAECNIRAARKLYDGSGHSPWGG